MVNGSPKTYCASYELMSTVVARATYYVGTDFTIIHAHKNDSYSQLVMVNPSQTFPTVKVTVNRFMNN